MILFHEIDTPALMIDLEIVMRNLVRVMEFAHRRNVVLRPHIKTHKTPELARLQMEKGARGITVASLGEAVVMADAGLMDIFMAYEIIGSAKLTRLVELLRRPIHFSSAVDSLEGALALNQAACQNNLIHEILIEVDTGLGRCGVRGQEKVLTLAKAIKQMPGLKLVGIFTHEGQAYIANDREKIKEIARAVAQELIEAAQCLRTAGFECDVVSVGSTPAWEFTATGPGITEMRPGTFIFNDRIQLQCGSAQLADCAATILATVISRPAADRVIIDAGSKTFSDARPFYLNGFGQLKSRPDLIVNWTNEEHGAILGAVSDLAIGARVEIIPNHICTTVNMFDTLFVRQSDQILAEWRIAARGMTR